MGEWIRSKTYLQKQIAIETKAQKARGEKTSISKAIADISRSPTTGKATKSTGYSRDNSLSSSNVASYDNTPLPNVNYSPVASYYDTPDKVTEAFMTGAITINEANMLLSKMANANTATDNFQPYTPNATEKASSSFWDLWAMRTGLLAGLGINAPIYTTTERFTDPTGYAGFEGVNKNLWDRDVANALISTQPTPQQQQVLKDVGVGSSGFGSIWDDVKKPLLYVGIGILVITILPKLIGGK